MNIIEQRIRIHIRKQLMLEAAGDNLSGYDIKIPSSKLVGDLKRWRVERINKQAIENKCHRGFLIVAKKVLESGDDSLLMGDIARTIAENNTFKTYFSNDYRIVISSPIQRGKRKIYAVWIIDMRTAKPTPFRLLLNKLQNIQSRDVYQYYQKFEKYTIGTTEIIDQSRAIAWTNAIKNYLLYLETEKPQLYSQRFGTDDGIKQINSIPDFSGMNRIKIPTEAEADGNIAAKTTYVDYDWLQQNGFNADFIGTAIISTDPITGIKTMQPVNGNMSIRKLRSDQKGDFTGEFKNGAPYIGSVQFYERENRDYVNNITRYEGTMQATVSLNIIKPGDPPESDFQFFLLRGTIYYIIKDDMEAGKFVGTCSKNSNLADNGLYYERESEDKDYDLVAKIVNGNYISYGKPVKYPYKGPKDKKTLYQPKDNTDYVYAWFVDLNAWGQVLTLMHKNLVNNLITPDEFMKNITYITDPATVTKLSTEFNEGPNYVILKDKIIVPILDNAGDSYTYDPNTDARGIKLEWPGDTLTKNNIKYYSVLMKSADGKYLTDQFWLKASDVKSEEINYPFK